MIFSLAGLFIWSFLAATVLPLSSEVPLIVYVRSYNQFLLPVAVATIGNYLGSCTTYWLARRATGAFGRTNALQQSDSRAARIIRRFGQPALLLSWVPVVGDTLVAFAGAIKMPFVAFSAWTALGKLLRYIAVSWAVAAGT
ncbi:MAG: VTT domain-containing protein [Acidobacteriota bacterium]|nr:VTT domain-containing protein [Acidobacteriota bacterium]